MNGYSVKITYRDKELNKICENEYSLSEYTENVRYELLGLLTQIEVFADALGKSRDKSDWSPQAVSIFKRIRHKLLDEANSVARLPDNMYYNGKLSGNISAGRAVAEIINASAMTI